LTSLAIAVWKIFRVSTSYHIRDFMDAFGNRHKGSVAIVNAMMRQLASPQVRQRQTTWKPPVVRFVRDDVAIVYQDYETVGQTTPIGRGRSKA
jgi:hypothetical protein